MAVPEWTEPPDVTQEKLDALEPGDTVFHKAFGYGEVVGIDRERGTIEVVIGLDEKGKPKYRKFLFPNVFEQGLLTVWVVIQDKEDYASEVSAMGSRPAS